MSRFSYGSNPFSNPFSGRSDSPDYTGSVSRAPTSSVSAAPLAPVGGQQSYGQQPSYTPPAQHQAVSSSQGTGPFGANADWTINGGTPIVVGPGENLNVISTRYGVPAGAIVAANGLPATQPLAQGQRIVIPVYRGASASGRPQHSPNVTASTTPSYSQPRQPQPQQPRQASGGAAHTVAPGETLFALSRRYGVSHREIAAANGLPADTQLRVGQRVTIPGSAGNSQVAAAPAPSRPAPVAQAPRPQQPRQIATTPVAALQPEVRTPPASVTPQIQPAVARPAQALDQASAMTSEASGPDFRWPVRGRIISGFGRKPDGSSSDGIKLAVPEGTPIRAAESGTVAYAGSDLSEYGQLVLVTHENGWVTAYAHASEILVKKGDVIRRGQVIARAGRTGGVSAPQLHFEVRNRTSPVDPLDHLPRS